MAYPNVGYKTYLLCFMSFLGGATITLFVTSFDLLGTKGTIDNKTLVKNNVADNEHFEFKGHPVENDLCNFYDGKTNVYKEIKSFSSIAVDNKISTHHVSAIKDISELYRTNGEVSYEDIQTLVGHLVTQINEHDYVRVEVVNALLNNPSPEEKDILMSSLMGSKYATDELNKMSESLAVNKNNYGLMIDMLAYGADITQPVKNSIREMISSKIYSSDVIELLKVTPPGILDDDLKNDARQQLNRVLFESGEPLTAEKKIHAMEGLMRNSDYESRKEIALKALSHPDIDIQSGVLDAISGGIAPYTKDMRAVLVALARDKESPLNTTAAEILQSKDLLSKSEFDDIFSE